MCQVDYKRDYRPFVFLVLLSILSSCNKEKTDPQAQLPSYFRIPTTLTGYVGSGLFTLSGDLTLRAEGPEQLDATAKTYTGVLGSIKTSVTLAQFTVGQPLPYAQTSTVPVQYESNGELRIMNTSDPGTYPMGVDSQPTPTGVIAELILNLPGPQVYFTRTGSLTIASKTLIRQENGNSLYRITGTFTAVLNAAGVGTTAGKAINTTGTFDLLLLAAS